MSTGSRSELLSIHVSEIPAAGYDVDGEVTFEELEIFEDEVTELPWPVHFHLHVSQLGEDLLVSGRVWASVRLMCDRCAEFSRHDLPESPVCHRYENVAGQVVDLTDDVREDILMSFPQAHLCSETCKGVCPRCGKNLNEGPCDCPAEAVESDAEEAAENPWSALDGFKF